jgi:hypothetical protein
VLLDDLLDDCPAVLPGNFLYNFDGNYWLRKQIFGMLCIIDVISNVSGRRKVIAMLGEAVLMVASAVAVATGVRFVIGKGLIV